MVPLDDENVALHPFADVESEISEKDDELGVRSNAVDAASIDQSDAADAAKIGVGRLRDTDVSSSAATKMMLLLLLSILLKVGRVLRRLR